MSTLRPSSNDVLISLFPKIEDSLTSMFLKFTLECDPYFDKKDMKLNLPNDFLNNLTARFPRVIYGYKIAVERYVSFGQYAPQQAIELLLTFLPKSKNNELFRKFVNKIRSYGQYSDIFDDVVLLFVADCIAQLLSINDDVSCWETLIQLAHPLLTPCNDPICEHLRLLLINQFSVIYSFISIKHLDTLFKGFQNALSRDIPSALLLNKFLRLVPSPTITIAMIEEFLAELFAITKNFPKKASPAEIVWAQSLTYLIAQIKTEGLPSMAASLTNIYNYVTGRMKDNEPLIYHYRLAAIILMRDNALLNSKYKEFINKYIVDKVKKNPECALNAFLLILRGNWFSRSSLFWEWGSFHHNHRQGIEATHLYEPTQEQRNNPDSFTELFFKTFAGTPGIEQYSKVLSEILINLAARDFIFFSRETVPRFMIALGPKCIFPLSECLLQISAPEYHFEEWISDMPLNSGVKIELEIKTLFNSIKSQLFQLVDQLQQIEPGNTAYWFDLKGSFSAPVFELPLKTQPISSNMTYRITEATNTVSSIINTWKFNEDAAELTLKFESVQIENISYLEQIYVIVLTFYPHIITYGDLLTPSFSDRLKNYILSKSKAVSMFAIDMLDHLYAANSAFRLAILNLVLSWLPDLYSPEHIFIILELFVKLFDLSLRPAAPPKPGQDGTAVEECPSNLIQEFTDTAQATLIYLLAMPCPELRDLCVCAIERLSKFANSLKTTSPLEHILTDLDLPISNAVAYKVSIYDSNILPLTPSLPATQIPFRTAACSRYNNFFSFYIPEVISSFEHQISITIIERLIKMTLKTMSKLDANGNYAKFDYANSLLYRNLANIISNSVPTIDHNMYKLLINQYPLDFVSFYNYQVMSGFDIDERRIKLAPLSKMVNDMFISFLKFLGTSTNDKHNDLIVKCFSMCRWTTAANFAPEFNDWLKTANFSQNQNALVSVLKVIHFLAQNPDFKFTLSCQPLYKDILTTIANECHKIFNSAQCFSESKIKTRKDNYQPLITNYLSAMWFVFTALTTDIDSKIVGPFRIPKSFAWLGENNPLCTDIMKMTCNFVNFKNSTDYEVQFLGENAERLISSIIASSLVLLSEKEEQVRIYEKYLFNIQTKGWPTMHLALHRNFKHLISLFAKHSYETAPNQARTYFKAIFNTIIPDTNCLIDRTKNMRKFEDKRTAQILTTMMYTLNNDQVQQNLVIDEEQLNASERVFNYDILSSSGQILFISFIYLMDDVFDLRSAAFNLILRLVPFVLAVLEAHDPAKAAEAVKKLEQYAPIFHSSIITVPPSTIKRIAGIVANFVPQISELVIKETFEFMRVSTPDSLAYNTPQSAVLEILFAFLKNVSITSRNVMSEVSAKFAIYTPYTSLEQLVILYPSIKTAGRANYLDIWGGICNSEEALKQIVTFLLHYANRGEYAQAVQTIMLFLSQGYTTQIIQSLSERITFAYWYYNNIQIHISEKNPPVFDFQEYQTIFSTLVELAQIVPQQLVPELHLIIHFALLYYDFAPKIFCELLFIIMSGLQNCPDSITKSFLPPGALTWDLSKPIKGLSDDRQPISCSEIAGMIVEYFTQQKGTKILQNWGKEAVRWATGCGDLKIASRSAMILSRLLSPVDGRMIVSVIRNAHNLMRVPTSSESGEYLMSIFTLLSAIIDKRVTSSKFAPSFKYIFDAACEFIKITPDPRLTQAALTIVAKYVIHGQTEYEVMRDLLATFCDLMVTMEDRRAVDGAFMACMHQSLPPANITGTHINQLAFIAFLPRIYSALASCHNIEPYLTEVSEIEVHRVLQCAVSLAAHENFLPQNLTNYFLISFKKPSTATLDEFALKCAAHLTEGSFQAVVEAVPLLVHICKGKDIALREAVFSIVFAFLGIGEFISAADAFSPIVAIAADSSSEASSNLLQRFMELAEDESKIAVDLPIYNFPSRNQGQISRKLEELDKETIQLPTGEVVLDDCSLLIVPQQDKLWQHDIFKGLKTELSQIKVMPFTKDNLSLDGLRQEVVRSDQKVTISADPADYIEYKNF